ncbi:MAG: hypothetical protein B7Y80_18960 [Hyphomicrobium sp. 32-62-53]|nr:MAG: hypothetical protein B7Z29_17650 [Hyphomicrobium sp. 12-62-95]OYX97694.1 MAG: hypothetical protein B7Y80_18960 [Hyphomicrobium sp. 32-62-53]
MKLAIIGQTGFGRATRSIAFVFVGAAALAAFAYDVVWLGAALSALFIWDLFRTVVTSRRVKKGAALTEAHMTASLRSLELIRRELATGAFDPDAMRERLKRAEDSGAYVPSMIYPLLQMSVLRYGA